jgi:FecR protein
MTDRDPPSPLLRLKASEPLPLTPSAEAARRERVVGRIDSLRAELRAEKPHAERKVPLVHLSRWKWALAAMVPLAAALLIFVGSGDDAPLIRVDRGEVTVQSIDGTKLLTPDSHWLGADDVFVSTETTEAKIVLPSRTELIFAPQTRVQLKRHGAPQQTKHEYDDGEAQAETIRLEHGSLALSSSPGNPPGAVVVTTSHALVQVRGTTFAITIEQLHSRQKGTHVVVQRGEASVFSEGKEHYLASGQEWFSPEVQKPSAQASTKPSPPPRVPVEAGVPSRVKPGALPSPNSELAQQNQMFEAAQTARRAGKSELALQRFAALIRRFPASEQAHNARVEQFRLLHSLGRESEARRAAQAYLHAHPRGFAAREAKRLTREK